MYSTYTVTNVLAGIELGRFTAKSENEALEILARDSGYKSYRELCTIAPIVTGEIVVIKTED